MTFFKNLFSTPKNTNNDEFEKADFALKSAVDELLLLLNELAKDDNPYNKKNIKNNIDKIIKYDDRIREKIGEFLHNNNISHHKKEELMQRANSEVVYKSHLQMLMLLIVAGMEDVAARRIIDSKLPVTVDFVKEITNHMEIPSFLYGCMVEFAKFGDIDIRSFLIRHNPERENLE